MSHDHRPHATSARWTNFPCSSSVDPPNSSNSASFPLSWMKAITQLIPVEIYAWALGRFVQIYRHSNLCNLLGSFINLVSVRFTQSAHGLSFFNLNNKEEKIKTSLFEYRPKWSQYPNKNPQYYSGGGALSHSFIYWLTQPLTVLVQHPKLKLTEKKAHS